jgi:hypothetical protein
MRMRMGAAEGIVLLVLVLFLLLVFLLMSLVDLIK